MCTARAQHLPRCITPWLPYLQGLFEQAIERLEAVASRLEASEARLSGAAPPAPMPARQSTGNAAPTAPAAAKSRAVPGCSITAPAAPAGASDSVAAYDALVVPVLRALVDAGASLGPDVGKATQIINRAFEVSGCTALFVSCETAADIHAPQSAPSACSQLEGSHVASLDRLIHLRRMSGS